MKTKKLTFNSYQKKAFSTAIYPRKGNNLYYPALGLGEAGEIQNKVKKVMRDTEGLLSKQMKSDIAYEIGDLLWYCAALATELGFKLEDIAIHNIEKLYDRQKRNKLKGSGDSR